MTLLKQFWDFTDELNNNLQNIRRADGAMSLPIQVPAEWDLITQD